MRFLYTCALISALFIFIGCPENDDDTGDDDTGDDDTGDDDDDSGVVDTPLVVEARAYPADDASPIEGVAVAASVGGETTEGITGADGRVTFETIDANVVDDLYVVGFKQGYVAGGTLAAHQAYLAETLEDGAVLPLWLTPHEAQPAQTIQLHGQAVNMSNENYSLTVTSETGAFYEAPGSAWWLEVPAGESGHVVAAEWIPGPLTNRGVDWDIVAWTTADYGALTEDTELTLDLSDALTPTRYSGTLTIPDHGGDLFETGYVMAQLNATTEGGQRSYFLGASEYIDVTADPQVFEFDFAYVEPAFATNVRSIYHLTESWMDPYEAFAEVHIDGPPAEGDTAVDFPAPPLMSSYGNVSLIDSLTWTVDPSTLDDDSLSIQMHGLGDTGDATNGYQLIFHIPKDVTEVHFPDLPSGVDELDVYGTSTLLVLLAIEESSAGWVERLAYGGTFTLHP